MTEPETRCHICLCDDRNEFLYGDWKSSMGLNVHYFCLLSGSKILQKGNDKQGILGYLVRDVNESVKEFRDVKCHYCGRKSAAINCAVENCASSWHYTCGTRNTCMTSFIDQYESYCSKHVPTDNEGKRHGTEFCSVCLNALSSYNPVDSIISSCCLKLDDWEKCFVHKKCVMRYVKNAGYDSMCINCPMEGLTRDDWQTEMRKKGIFIPWQAAIWEQEGQFNDQVKNKCKHPKCPTPTVKSNVWTCFVCGCFPRHLKCAKVTKANEYYCPKCFDQSFVQRVPKY